MKGKLKPCPFCGSTKLKIECKTAWAGIIWAGITGDQRTERHTFSCRCNVCHARGGTSSGRVILGRINETDLPEWATTDDSLKEQAIDAWNRMGDDG